MLLAAARSLLHLFFPHLCAGCGSDQVQHEQLLCLHCIERLPLSKFETYADNPIEKIFYGRLPLVNAASYVYFTKDSLLQHLMHQLKYHGKKEIGLYFGKRMGEALQQSGRFTGIDALLPLPLFPERERKRGYNQATLLCEGMSGSLGLPLLTKSISRQATESQTHKNRMERWQNISGSFTLQQPDVLRDKHILLVDDVVTTGATLEACGQELLKVPGLRLSIMTLACTIN